MKQSKNKQPKIKTNQSLEQLKQKSVKSKGVGQAVSNGVKLMLYGAVIVVMGIGLLWSFNGANQPSSTAQEPTTESTPIAEMAIEGIISLVNGYCDSGDIKGQGLCNSLLSKLEAAIEARDRGQPDVACNQLNAFINEVGAQNENKIPVDVATELIGAAGSACAIIEVTVTPVATGTPVVVATATVTATSEPATPTPTNVSRPIIVIGTVIRPSSPPTQVPPQPTATFEPLDGRPIGGYVFSTARIVPNSEGDRFEFYEWVAEDKLLVKRNGSLGILDINTGIYQPYGLNSKSKFSFSPIWLTNNQLIIYSTFESENGRIIAQHIWLDNGTQPLSPTYTNDWLSPLVSTPNGDSVVFYDAQGYFKQVGAINYAEVNLPIDIRSHMPVDVTTDKFLEAISSNDKTKAVFFNEEWLMVADFVTGDVQTVVPGDIIKNDMPDMYQNNNPDDFHIRAITWSPMGDKLVIKTGKLGGYIWNLFILNLHSETLEYIPNINSYTMGEAWAPDNEHLMILRKVNEIDEMTIGALYLINTIDMSMELVAALPNNAWVGSVLTWSPNGRYIVTRAVVSEKLNTYVVEVEIE